MEKFCCNPYCENEGASEVGVSVEKASDQQRILCTACRETYTWGVQHGRMTALTGPLGIALVTDRGYVVYARTFSSTADAEAALVEYLREEYGFGEHESDPTYWFDWTGEHAYLTAEVVEQDGPPDQAP